MPGGTGFRRYGGPWWHLLALSAAFCLIGYVVALALHTPVWPMLLAWFLGAVVVHDLVLWPLYALVDRGLTSPRVQRVLPRRAWVSVANHLRLPTAAAVLLFCVYFPGIVGQGGRDYRRATGHEQEGFAVTWLWLVAALYATSAVVYAVRLGLARRRTRRRARRPAGQRENLDRSGESEVSRGSRARRR